MPALTGSQQAVITALIDSAPDSAIRSLDMALCGETGGGAMGDIRDLVSREATERRVRRIVLGPMNAMCSGQTGLRAFPREISPLLWRALKAADPDGVEAVIALCAPWREDDIDPAVLDGLCARAAYGLRDATDEAFSACAHRLDQARPDGAAAFAACLDLMPMARGAVHRLPDWLARMTDERAAAARLAFRDAVAIAPDAGPRLFEILAAQLAEPAQILRVVSAVMDRPSDAYVASSEMSGIAGALLDDIDRRVDDVRTFDPAGGRAAGAAAALACQQASAWITEFEQALELRKDGPYGQRLLRLKKALSQTVEQRFGKIDAVVESALPIRSVRIAGRMMRGQPRLDQEPQPPMITKAEGLLTFLADCRTAAAAGGFAALRNKVSEKVEGRLDQYAEDLIENLRLPEPEEEARARTMLEVTAGFVALLRDEKSAEIVRRRAAA